MGAQYSGHLSESRQGIINTVIQASNSATVVSPFIYFQAGSQKKFGGKLLNGEFNGVCGMLKSHVLDDTRFCPGVLAGEKFGRRLIVKSFVRLCVRNHVIFLCALRQAKLHHTEPNLAPHENAYSLICYPHDMLYGVSRI
jgi:hypothetical protein